MRGPIEVPHHAVLALAFRSASSFSIMATRASNSLEAMGRYSYFPHQSRSAVTGQTA